MRAWLIRCLLWMIRQLEPDFPPPEAGLWAMAFGAVQALQGDPHTGHYKRTQAIKRVAQVYPKVRRRDISLAVEYAVRHLP